MDKKYGVILTVSALLIGFFLFNNKNISSENPDIGNKENITNYNEKDLQTIYLAGGCFWGVDEYFDRVPGVIEVVSGYANGTTENPRYEEVIYANTGHAETVSVTFDTTQIDLIDILLYYFKVIDPTSLNKQGNDIGTQYRTGIYYEDENQVETIEKVIEVKQKDYSEQIMVEVEPLEHFFLAEEYHQDYLKKNPRGYCTIDLKEAEKGVARDKSF